MVISVGTTVPACDSVAALYALTKSMIAMPCGPSAVPTGGAGVALPASIWILTIAATFFLAIGVSLAIRVSGRSELGDLTEIHLDECLAAEDIDEHLQLEVVGVDLGDLPGEVRERTLLDAHGLADLVIEFRLGARGGLLGRSLRGEEGSDLATAKRRGPLTAIVLTDETGDVRCVADAVPGLVVHLAAHEQVAGEH